MFPPWSCVGFTLFTGPGVLSVAFIIIADHWLEVRLISLKKKTNLNAVLCVRDSSFSVHYVYEAGGVQAGSQQLIYCLSCKLKTVYLTLSNPFR